jgi:hypothetical protein
MQNLKCSRIDPNNVQITFYPYKNRFQWHFLPGNTFFCKSEIINLKLGPVLKPRDRDRPRGHFEDIHRQTNREWELDQGRSHRRVSSAFYSRS